MTDAASPDTPTAPAHVQHAVEDASRIVVNVLLSRLGAREGLADLTADVVSRLAAAGLLSLSGDSTRGSDAVRLPTYTVLRMDLISKVGGRIAGLTGVPALESPTREIAHQIVDAVLPVDYVAQLNAERGRLYRAVEDEGSLRSRASGTPVKAPRLRRSGSPWTLRVHTWTEGMQTPTHTVSNQEVPADGEHHHGHLLPAAEFDELVVGRWLHVEQMDDHAWWMNIGGVTVHVTADRDGRPTRVSVDGPEDYDAPREGCEYSLNWTGTATETTEETS